MVEEGERWRGRMSEVAHEAKDEQGHRVAWTEWLDRNLRSEAGLAMLTSAVSVGIGMIEALRNDDSAGLVAMIDGHEPEFLALGLSVISMNLLESLATTSGEAPGDILSRIGLSIADP